MYKKTVYSAIAGDETLTSLGYREDEVYRSVSMENTQSSKFIVLRWGTENTWMHDHGNDTLTIWVYDEPGSYDAIDEALRVIRKVILPAVTNFGGVSQINWNGSSEDLYDDVMKRIVRNAIFTVNHHNS